MTRSALVLLSGGADSATCLAYAINHHQHVEALAVTYGQRHARELDAAQAVANHSNITLHRLDLTPTRIYDGAQSALIGNTRPLPQGTYQQQKTATETIATEVPFRNGLFLAAAAAKALALDPAAKWTIYLGAHADDTAADAYPDCSQEFIDTMRQALETGTADRVTLAAPFAGKPKTEVIRYGLAHHVPYEHTWSCYAGGPIPCGTCATCIDRAKAFAANNTTDPTEKETHAQDR